MRPTFIRHRNGDVVRVNGNRLWDGCAAVVTDVRESANPTESWRPIRVRLFMIANPAARDDYLPRGHLKPITEEDLTDEERVGLMKYRLTGGVT